MLPNKHAFLVALCWVFALGKFAGGLPSAVGEDFRVENEVFLGSGQQPIARSTTIFHEGVVYDFMQEPAEIVVFQPARGRFVLLQSARRVQTELTTAQLAAFTVRLQQRAEAQQDPFVKFLAVPDFEEQFDAASGRLTLSSPWMTYRLVLATAGSESVCQQYREFCDGYARLNALLNPGSRPPFARLLVNAAVAKRRSIAREVHLTLTPKKSTPSQRIEIRSRHRLASPLGQSDLDQVAEAGQCMRIFARVGFGEYCGSED